MATKEQQQKVLAVLGKLYKKGKDWETLTIKGLQIQKLPSTKTKPSTLAVVFNPTINGIQARKGKYFHNKEACKQYFGAFSESIEMLLTILTYVDKVNPKGTAVISTVKSDVDFDFEL